MRSSPINYIILSFFTFFESNILSGVLTNFDNDTIICAALVTACIFSALIFIAHYNKHKQYSLPRYLFQLMIADIIIGLVCMFFFSFDSVLISIVQAVISSCYLMIDLHLVMNNKNERLSLDDHVFASLMIYTDLIRLFIKILEILDKLNKKEKKDK